MMKKIIVSIFLVILFSISLILPPKVFALDCSGGISGQFLDENGKPFNFKSGEGIGWDLKTNNVLDPSSKTKDHMLWGLSDSQGKFRIEPTTNNKLDGFLVLGWTRKDYLSEELILNQCTGLTVYLKSMGPNNNPLCGTPCETSHECTKATDGCISCFNSMCAHPSWSGGYLDEFCFSQECLDCIGEKGSWTALGCIPTEPEAFTKFLLGFAIGIGGGIAFLLMIFGGLQIIFSGGNPDKVKAGKEIITAALGGLLLIIFSVFILKIIGVDILQIPGFGK